VVPAVVNAGGHVNKFLGDGALAVFGAPNDLADHADAAVTAAILIQRLVVMCREVIPPVIGEPV
jgi:class 3 adenylate cyclase